MSEHKTSAKRRKLMKALAAGGGVWTAGQVIPKEWKKPVVESILLPEHAHAKS